MKHNYVVTFTKRTNLLEYMARDSYCGDKFNHNTERMQNYYAKERDVRLVLLARHENGRAFCTIKCPINPLPVKGEFEVPNMAVLYRFLEREGWTKVDFLSAQLFE